MMESIADNIAPLGSRSGVNVAFEPASSSGSVPLEMVEGVATASPLAINETPLRYWRLTGYSMADLLKMARARDSKEMFMIASFDGLGNVSARVSSRTWERQEGHYPTMIDVCCALASHPVLQGVKGELLIWLEDGLWDWQQHSTISVPVMAFGRHVNDTRTMLIPDPAFFESFGYAKELEQLAPMIDDQPWSARKDTVFFRGAATGLGFSAGTWGDSARGRLVLSAAKLAQSQVLDAKLTRYSHVEEDCREELIEAGVVDVEVPLSTFCSYKYLVDADGYCCAWKSLFLKMAMGAVVLKIDSPYQQWYHHRLRPWKHYVPLAADLSDFEAVYTWLREHAERAEEIARNGQQFVRGLLYEDALKETAIYARHLIGSQNGE